MRLRIRVDNEMRGEFSASISPRVGEFVNMLGGTTFKVCRIFHFIKVDEHDSYIVLDCTIEESS